MPDRSLHRTNYGACYARIHQLAGALLKAGLQKGDRVATLMWNHYAHFEAYLAVPCTGAVVHTLNLRLSPADLGFIVNHAQDRFLIVDDVLLPLFDKFKSDVNLERIIVVPLTGNPVPDGCANYEDFLRSATGPFIYPEIDEHQAAAMCYTSGTTGSPKGVVYSHRSELLHSLVVALPDMMGYSHRDTILPVVPMFHANAWGIPYTAAMIGSRLVFPGPHLDAENILDLLESENVTATAGVPTVAMRLSEALEQHPGRWKLQPGLRMLVGGSAPPESLIRKLDRQGIHVLQGWGLTESSPLVTLAREKPHMEGWSDDSRYRVRSKAGLPGPFAEVRVVGDNGEVPWDDQTMGEIQLRGPWIAASYYNLPDGQGKWSDDGWFCTGDIGTLDADGYLKICDRSKDLIKSGGEWISSVDLENAIVSHPEVREAAVIAVPHPKWQERPLAVVVLMDGARLGPEDLKRHLSGQFASWQVPEAYVFVDELPHTSTGKLLKTELRKRYRDWKWA
jgi:fatty-acyl-CoA synthase